MIATTTHQIFLQKGYFKVQSVYPVLHQTFLILARRQAGHDILVHCSLQGKNLFEHVFSHMVDSIAVPSPYQAIIPLTRENALLHIDLRTHTLTHIPFEFQREESDQAALWCFSETGMMCVVEWGVYNDPRLKLSYFNTPILTHRTPCAYFQSRDDEWTHEYFLKRGNNRSMVVWLKARQEAIEIRLCQAPPQGGRAQMRTVRSLSPIGSLYGLNNCDCDLLQAWETLPGCFWLVVLSSRSDSLKPTQKNQPTCLYILDAVTGTLRENKFNVARPYCELTIDHTYLGGHIMIRTFAYENSRAKETPVYFISSTTEELIGQTTWECSHLIKDTIPGYDGTLLVSCEYENEDVHVIKVSLVAPAEYRMMGLHLLLEMYADFDENFLQEALEFLPSPAQTYIL